jgi:hypothetical protein
MTKMRSLIQKDIGVVRGDFLNDAGEAGTTAVLNVPGKESHGFLMIVLFHITVPLPHCLQKWGFRRSRTLNPG